MKTLTVVTEWMNSNPNELEVKRVENLITRMIAGRSKRELYQLEVKFRKLNKVEKELKSVSVPIPADLTNNIKEVEKRIREVKKAIPVTVKKAKE